MKTLKDLTLEDVRALSKLLHDSEAISFEVGSFNVDIAIEDYGLGLIGYYTIEFNTNGEATADYGDANPVEAGLDFYVEMKRRGFAVPALDEVYGQQVEVIHSNLQEKGDHLTKSALDIHYFHWDDDTHQFQAVGDDENVIGIFSNAEMVEFANDALDKVYELEDEVRKAGEYIKELKHDAEVAETKLDSLEEQLETANEEIADLVYHIDELGE